MATLAATTSSWTQTTVANQQTSSDSYSASIPRQMQPHLPRQHSGSPNPSGQSSPPTVEVGYHQSPYARSPQAMQYQSPPSQQQQQLSQWTPSPTATPFYPHYPPYFAASPHVSTQPYFDPAHQQQQFAQWAYQQMMFNAQQQQLNANDYQRNRTPSGGSHHSHRGASQLAPQSDFYPSPYGFPSNGTGQPSQTANQYQGFHPYRRPGGSRQSSGNRTNQEAFPNSGQVFQPPYVTTDFTSSSSSINSGSGSSKGSPQQNSQVIHPPSRTRTSSNNVRPPDKSTSTPTNHSRSDSSSTVSAGTNRSQTRPALQPSAARATSSTISPSATSVASNPTLPTSQRRPSKPSPLSQDVTVNTDDQASRRLSRDDSDLAFATGSLSGISNHVTRTGGLKGRLRRALAINANDSNIENKVDSADSDPRAQKLSLPTSKATAVKQNRVERAAEPSSPPQTLTLPVDPAPSTRGRVKSKSLFNMKFNASTDNISVSSTVSSASVMIRKIGSMGKIARRSSIAGITRLFKDKDKKKKGQLLDDAASDDEFKRTGKASRAEASVSHATAEFDRGSFGGDDLKGLSPAAQLARQHTLRSNAADAAKALEHNLAQEEHRERTTVNQDAVTPVPPTWERGTAKRNGQSARSPIVMQNGGEVLVEDGDEHGSDSDDEHELTLTRDDQWPQQYPGNSSTLQYADFDEDDDEGSLDEDVTVRLGSLDLQQHRVQTSPTSEPEDPDSVQWRVWRTYQKDLKPSKGILRNADKYNQNTFGDSSTPSGIALSTQLRVRSYSHTGAPHGEGSEPGPLARIPSPDPDHIDGLHKTDHQRNSIHDSRSSDSFDADSKKPLAGVNFEASPGQFTSSERSIFNHPNLNSSAPVLSVMNSSSATPALSHRDAPVRRITFAANLSIYDTFSATIYDRRCEPVTCNRLTPALAQRIKEELNTYKMEEMEVHVASRIHTHFFV